MAVEESAIARRRKAALRSSNPDYVKKRDEILAAATRVFFRYGYHEATIDHVAKLVNLDRASLYYYVGSKSDLFEAIAIAPAECAVVEMEQISRSDAPPAEKLISLVERAMALFDENYPNLYVYLREQGRQLATGTRHDKRLREIQDRNDAAFTLVLQEGQDAGVFNLELPARLLTFSIVGMVAWSHTWFKPGPLTGAEVGRALGRVAVNGLTSPSGHHLPPSITSHEPA